MRVPFLFMEFRRWRFAKWVAVALAVTIVLCVPAVGPAMAQALPACTRNGTTYPCAVGGTLEFASAPTGSLFTGFSVTTRTQTLSGPGQASFNGTLQLASVCGLAVLGGVQASLTCGVTGAATFTMTVSTPGGPVEVVYLAPFGILEKEGLDL